jgi:4-hydroxybenzoate polyprenyltransferase
VKNVLVLVSPLAAHALFDPQVLRNVGFVFAAFCAAASGVYVVNDLLDIRADRAHPRKRSRPLASGRLPIAGAAVIGPMLMALGIGTAFYISVPTGGVLVAYVIVSMAYSMYLKTQPLVDVFALSVLYTLRVFAGEVAAQIELSIWLLSFSGFMFLSLAFLKRMAEYHAMLRAKNTYETRRGYRPADLEMLKIMGVSASYIAAMVLGLYISTTNAAHQYGRPLLLWAAVPIFLFWQSRMWLAASRGFMHDDPIVYAARDWVSQLCLALLLGVYAFATLL